MKGLELLLARAGTKQAIADVAGVSRIAIVNWFGRGEIPAKHRAGDTQVIKRLCNAFNLTEEELLKR